MRLSSGMIFCRGLGAILFVVIPLTDPSWGIDVMLTMGEARQSLATGRELMEGVETTEQAVNLIQNLDNVIRIGAKLAEEPCGTSAIVKTKRYWLEYFGRREIAESRRQQRKIRMPDSKIQEILDMPTLELEIGLCGNDEVFAEDALVVLQQGGWDIEPVDMRSSEKGRKIPGMPSSYVSRVTAQFAYVDFNANAKTIITIFFPDGTLAKVETDFSNIR